MKGNRLDGDAYLAALCETVNQLRDNREKLNRINVFPVPDGDTGNNLLHTLEAAWRYAAAEQGGGVGAVSKAAARGALSGSCGNSGAIFAQFLQGWSDFFYNLQDAGAAELAGALQEGARKAYAAVEKPVEGTILTVARAAAEAARQASAEGDMAATLQAAYREARRALRQSPELLEALGRRGVVDAGGWGLLLFFNALLKAMGVPVEDGPAPWEPSDPSPLHHDAGGGGTMEHPYDLEFSYLSSTSVDSEKVKGLLRGLGSELITGSGDGGLHVHIHSRDPLAVVEKAAAAAPLQELIIRDMRRQRPADGRGSDNNGGVPLLALGRSPGFLALFVLAGAEAAVSVGAGEKISRLLREERFTEPLVLSTTKEVGLPAGAQVHCLEEEVRLLAAILALDTVGKPRPEEIDAAAGNPRVAYLLKKGVYYRALVKGERVAEGPLDDALAGAASFLAPQPGEVLTLFYGSPAHSSRAKDSGQKLKEAYPFLQVDVFFGGQEQPFILAVE